VRQILATGKGHRGLAIDTILGEYIKGILRGLEGNFLFQPIISPQLRDLGDLNFFLRWVSKGMCSVKISVFSTEREMRGEMLSKFPNFGGRKKTKSDFGTYGVDQSVSCTNLSGNRAHPSCGG